MKRRKILTLILSLALFLGVFAMASCNTETVNETTDGITSNTQAESTDNVDITEAPTETTSGKASAPDTEDNETTVVTEDWATEENTGSSVNTEISDITESESSTETTEGTDIAKNTETSEPSEASDATEPTETDDTPKSVLEAIEKSMDYFGQVSGALSVSVDKYEKRDDASAVLANRYVGKASNRILALGDEEDKKTEGGQTSTINRPILDDIVGMSLIKQMIEQIDMIFAETKVVEYEDGSTYTQYSQLGWVYERFTALEESFAEDGTSRIDITDVSGKVSGYIERNEDGSYTHYDGRGAITLELDGNGHFVFCEDGKVEGSKGDDNPIGYYYVTKYELSEGALKVSYASQQIITDWYKAELLKYVEAKQYYEENNTEGLPLSFPEAQIEMLMEIAAFGEYIPDDWQVEEYTVKNNTASIEKYTVYKGIEETYNYKFMAISVGESDVCLQSNFDFVADPYWMTENCGGLPEYREEEGYDWSADYDETFGRIFSEYEALLHQLLLFEGHSGEDPYWQMRFDRDSGEGVLKFVQNWRVEAGGEGVDNYPYPELWTVKGEVDHETVISYMDEIAELWGKEITVITYNFFNIVTDNDNVKM